MDLDVQQHAMIAGITLLISLALIGFLKSQEVILAVIFLVAWAVLVFLDFDKDYLYVSAASLGVALLFLIIILLFGVVEFHPSAIAWIPLWAPIFLVNLVISSIKFANWLSERM